MHRLTGHGFFVGAWFCGRLSFLTLRVGPPFVTLCGTSLSRTAYSGPDAERPQHASQNCAR
ncbi:hypothetical protein PsP108CL_10565 [Pseudomonas syringae]|nr:hypothetical protein [Pseudomonas syringae]